MYTGSGAPTHFHGDAWNAVAHGRKLWLLSPPAHARYSATPILPYLEARAEWVLENKNTEHPYHCVQEAGDVLYVPADWGHAVLNLRPTIGVAVEFAWGKGQRG